VSYTLRYASHLGYRFPEVPLFSASVASEDPVAHIDYAAELGFAGVQYARAVARPRSERRRVRKALERHGLETGCIVYADREIATAPLWGTTSPAARETWTTALEFAFEVANEVNARHVILFSGADPSIPIDVQHQTFIENLKRAAALAEPSNLVLCIENMSHRSRTGTLVSYLREGYEIVKAVDSPAVRLIFDTAHVQVMDGDLLENLHAMWDAIAVVQIADNPGRLEPGTGELNFPNILRATHRLGYRGLVELEHDWSHPGSATEQRGLDYLRAMDAGLSAT
jgi:hydroxypyruvate isomerase